MIAKEWQQYAEYREQYRKELIKNTASFVMMYALHQQGLCKNLTSAVLQSNNK